MVHVVTRQPISASAWYALALVSLVIWVLGTFVVPVGAGWIHLFLAAGVMLLIRWVVKGPLGE